VRGGGTAREHTSGVHGANRAFTFNLRDALRQFENQYILRALDQAGQDRKEAAKLLDISLSLLYRKIEELEIT
jgi:DNA-binding NtrC family response regulator